MHTVLIVLEGTATDDRIIDLAGLLLADRDLEIVLLHAIAVPPATSSAWPTTIVIEGYVSGEACGAVVAPLRKRLQAGLRCSCHEVPRLVPRHLILRGGLPGVAERCGLAQQRRDSIARLGTYARRLERHGIDGARITRDSAIGTVTEIIGDAAGHYRADLVVVGSRDAGSMRHIVGEAYPAPTPHSPGYAVLVVPSVDGTGADAMQQTYEHDRLVIEGAATGARALAAPSGLW